MTPPITQTIYGFPHKEVEQLIQNIWTTKSNELLDRYKAPWGKKQDSMHIPMIKSWEIWSAQVVIGIDSFPYSYPTAGASEGIKEIITAKSVLKDGPLVVFEGDYEGYERIALLHQLKVVKLNRNNWAQEIQEIPEKSLFWISQPAAVDGNFWPDFNDFLKVVSDLPSKPEIWVDLSYVGSTANNPHPINLNQSCVAGVVCSWSKPFGVYYHRIGALWSKKEQKGLWANQWFKNLFSLYLGKALCENFSLFELARKASTKQLKAIETLKQTHNVIAIPSDVSLMATIPRHKTPDSILNICQRSPEQNFVRVCLTPMFESQ